MSNRTTGLTTLAARFTAVLLGIVSPPARAETTAQVPTASGSGVRVRLYTPVSALPQFGFMPVRVSVDNLSRRDGTWTVRFVSGNPEASSGAIASSIELPVRAGQSGEAWHFVPMPDTAPSFTLEPVPASRRAVPIPPRQVTMAVIGDSPTVAGLETRVRGRFQVAPGAGSPPGSLAWAGRIEPGLRPGEKIGVATASIPIGFNEAPLTGESLPLGFDVDDDMRAMMGSVRRFVFKETIPDPSVGAAPKSTAWASFDSSLTAESAARRALAGTRLLDLPDGVVQTVSVEALTSGAPGDSVAWLAMFTQSGSSRLLSASTGGSLPPGTVVNLHRSSREGEVIRTITFIEPSALLALTREPAEPGEPGEPGVAAAEARATLLRHGFLRTGPEVTVSREFPGRPDFKGSPQHAGAVHWFEYGPARLLPKPIFGSLPPDTSVYLLPGPEPGSVVRCFAVGPRAPTTVASPAAGKATAPPRLRMTATGPGIVGAAELEFAGLQPAVPSQALPVAASMTIAPVLTRALLNGPLRGTPNVTPVAIDALPADWRTWSPYHAVLLREAEYAGMARARRDALFAWIRQGGLLYIEPTVDDLSGRGPLEARVPLRVEREGMGRVTWLPFSMDDYIAPEDQNLDASLWIKPAQPVDLIALMLFNTPAATLPTGEFLRPPALPADLAAHEASGGWWAAFLIGAFAVLAGPVSVFKLAPTGRRHRLFFTMPVLAGVFTAALMASILAADGFGGGGMRAAVVVSLPDSGSAVVYQDQVSGTGILGSGRFGLGESVLMANLPAEGHDSTGRPAMLGRGRDAAWGDWFRSHWASAQHLRTLAPVPGRVDVREGAGVAPVAVSTLPAALRDFVYIDSRNLAWHAAELPSGGGEVVLTRSAQIGRWPPVLPSGSKQLENLFTAAARHEPGRWVAHMESSALAPIPTLMSIRWRDDVVITGLVGPGDPVELPPLTPPPPISAEG